MPEEEEVKEADGRIRRKAVFSTNDVEEDDDDNNDNDAASSEDEDNEDEDIDEFDEHDDEEDVAETPKKKSKKSSQQVEIFFTFLFSIILVQPKILVSTYQSISSHKISDTLIKLCIKISTFFKEQNR